ncbi:protein BTG3-like [Bombina bombina]|uniref:protein BTG3-like n=1 Tax=Bombina bombina TaxID=8345 RepID=UPI00235ABBB5|nr:protein BTG3-like [Bombina bombina]
MRCEIEAAVTFLVKVLALKKNLKPSQLAVLGENMIIQLNHKYTGHWYPDKPLRGQAYRCIRINPWQYVDDALLQACVRSNIEYSKLGLPEEMTLWIDPYEVSGRFGEHTDYFTIATFKREVIVPEQMKSCREPTSDYSSEGLSSESVSENSSDEESPTEKPNFSKNQNNLSNYDSGAPQTPEISSTLFPVSGSVDDLKV